MNATGVSSLSSALRLANTAQCTLGSRADALAPPRPSRPSFLDAEFLHQIFDRDNAFGLRIGETVFYRRP